MHLSAKKNPAGLLRANPYGVQIVVARYREAPRGGGTLPRAKRRGGVGGTPPDPSTTKFYTTTQRENWHGGEEPSPERSEGEGWGVLPPLLFSALHFTHFSITIENILQIYGNIFVKICFNFSFERNILHLLCLLFARGTVLFF